MGDNMDMQMIIGIGLDASGVDAGVDAAKQKLSSLGNVPVDKSVRTLKDELKLANQEAQRIANSMGVNNDQFKKAAQRVADLKDQFGEYNKTIEAFNPDNKFQGIVSLAKGATGAIQGISGAMGFLGIESEKSNETLVKLQSLMNFSQALNSVDDIKNSFKNLALVMGFTKSSTEGATVATKGFGTAFKAIGIGLIVSLIAYLVTNFDDLKKTVVKFIPALGDLGGAFNKIKEVAMGVGNAIVQFVSTPIKTIIKLIQGDFKGAIEEVKKGMDVVGNYQKGAGDQANKNRLAEAREIAKHRVEENEKLIKHYQELGRDTYDMELRNLKLKKTLYDRGTKEFTDVLDEIQSLQNKHTKQMADAAQKAADERSAKAKQQREKELAERRAANDAARKLNEDLHKQNDINDEGSERAKELRRLQLEFDDKKEVLQKGNQSLTELQTWFRMQQTDINKKFDDKDAEDRKARLEKRLQEEKDANDKLLNAKQNQSSTEVINTQIENRILDTDTPEERKQKLNNVFTAEQQAKKEQLNIEIERLGSDASAIRLAKASAHQKELEDAEAHKDALNAIDDVVAEHKRETVGKMGEAAELGSQILGKTTAAGKALAVASTTISTYMAAQQAYASQIVPGDPSSVFRAVVAAAAATFAGLARVKQILSVKTPGASGGAGSAGAPTIGAAPTISAQLTAPKQQPQNVRVVNQKDQVVKAYITDRDLKSNQEKSNFLDKLGTV